DLVPGAEPEGVDPRDARVAELCHELGGYVESEVAVNEWADQARRVAEAPANGCGASRVDLVTAAADGRSDRGARVRDHPAARLERGAVSGLLLARIDLPGHAAEIAGGKAVHQTRHGGQQRRSNNWFGRERGHFTGVANARIAAMIPARAPISQKRMVTFS